MLTIDLAQNGSMLNMPPVFSICVRLLFKSPDKTIRNRVNEIRNKVKTAIEHVSHEELNQIMQKVKSRTSRYRVLTRHDLLNRLSRAGVFGVLTTAALLEDAGAQEAMLFLLHSKPHPYKGHQLLTRFFPNEFNL
jgi:hypothetical protein